MLVGCLSIFLILLLFVVLVYVGAAIIPIVGLFFLINSYIIYKKNINLTASKMQCSNCNSTNVKIISLQTGSQTQTNLSGSGSTFLGVAYVDGSHNSNTMYTFKREAICQDCGFNFDYLTDDDVINIKKKNKRKLICSIVFFIIASAFAVFFWISTSNDNDSSSNLSYLDNTVLKSTLL